MAERRRELGDARDKERAEGEEGERRKRHLELCEFGDEDTLSAMLKVREAAYMFDPRVNISLEAFQGPSMTAYEFKDVLRRVTRVDLTRKEVSALVEFFDGDGAGTVSGGDFVTSFFELRRDEQHKRLVVAQEKKEERKVTQAKIKEGKKIGIVEDSELLVEFGERDLDRGLGKIRTAAANFNPRSQSLAGFKADGAMGAAAFRREMRRALGVKLSKKELSAVISEWSSCGREAGSLDSQDFIARFFKMRNDGDEGRTRKVAA